MYLYLKLYILRQLLFSFILCLSTAVAWSQVSDKERDAETKGTVYNFEKAGFVQISANGYGLGYKWGEIKNYLQTNFYQVELSRVFDQREESHNKNISLRFNSISKSFKFGKQSDVYLARLMRGQIKYLSDRAKRKGVAVGYQYSGGASIGLAKPYYLNLIYPNDSDGTSRFDVKAERYSPETRNKFINYEDIYGGAGWYNGLTEISVIPGIHGHASLLFSIGRYDKMIKNIETGFLVDIFARKIPLMVETDLVKNRPFMVNLYISGTFGRRRY